MVDGQGDRVRRVRPRAGADVLMVLPPHWGGGDARTPWSPLPRGSEHIPVMLVTAPFTANQALGLRVIQRLVDEVPGVVAIKDDVAGEFAADGR